MRYSIEHSTVYTYTSAAMITRSLVHLRPRNDRRQRLLSHHLDIDPAPMSTDEHVDYFGNVQQVFSIMVPHTKLSVCSRSEVEILIDSYQPETETPGWENIVGAMRQPMTEDDFEACQFLHESPLVPLGNSYAAIVRNVFTPGRPIHQAALELNSYIHSRFSYQPGVTNVSTPVEDVLRENVGVCQDFAHVSLACLRSKGIPAKYVSGCIETGSDHESAFAGADVSHAWISVYCGNGRWLELDPTNNCTVRDRHVTVAYGRDFADISPMKGILLGGDGQHVEVAVSVRRIS